MRAHADANTGAAYCDGYIAAGISGLAGQTGCVTSLGCLVQVHGPTVSTEIFNGLPHLPMEIPGAGGWIEYDTSIHKGLFVIGAPQLCLRGTRRRFPS